jgi:glycosyltransferase involved in cell wall biosynthesis
MTPRVAIAHDYLTQRGGAERLVLSICRAFPDAEIHTLFYEPDQTYPEYQDKVIHTSPLNRIGAFRRDPRRALPLLAAAASRQRIDADVVIASSSGWAHAFPTTGKKIVYCHSPARWLYLPDDYLGDAGTLSPQRIALRTLAPFLKRWDRRAAMSAHRYLANSTVVRDRIRRVYGLPADTLFPPFSPDLAEGPQDAIEQLAAWAGHDEVTGGHHLVVSRLQPYKHVDRVIDAFRDLPEQRLLVIGRGPERDRLLANAPDNVRLVEGLTDAQMRWAYSTAETLIAASHEDFGLTPLEAGAHGVPTLALRAGGYLDTIEEGVNGAYFGAAEPAEVAAAVRRNRKKKWSRQEVRAVADRFNEDQFIGELCRHVGEVAGGIPDTSAAASRISSR